MKASELRDLSDNEILAKVDEARREIFGLRMRHATGELDNSARLGSVKKELARALTVARQRGITVHPTINSRTNG
jgi:large subunit ribosomal protein L29